MGDSKIQFLTSQTGMKELQSAFFWKKKNNSEIRIQKEGEWETIQKKQTKLFSISHYQNKIQGIKTVQENT